MSMPVARILLLFVDVARTRRVNSYLVNRPESILYDISVIIVDKGKRELEQKDEDVIDM